MWSGVAAAIKLQGTHVVRLELDCLCFPTPVPFTGRKVDQVVARLSGLPLRLPGACGSLCSVCEQAEGVLAVCALMSLCPSCMQGLTCPFPSPDEDLFFFFLFNDTLFISFLIRFERLDTLPGYRLQRHCPTSNYYLRRRKSGRQSPLPGVRIQRRCPWRHRIAGIAS